MLFRLGRTGNVCWVVLLGCVIARLAPTSKPPYKGGGIYEGTMKPIGPHFIDELKAKEVATGLKLVGVPGISWCTNDTKRALDPFPESATPEQRQAVEEVYAAHDPTKQPRRESNWTGFAKWLATKNRKWRAFFALSFAVVAWMVVAIELSFIPMYGDICEKSGKSDQKECATHHISLVALWHIGKFLEDHAGAITAVASGAIGFFTLTLWYATRKLHESAVEQADLAKQSIKLYRDNFIADQRPWLSTDVKIASPMNFQNGPSVLLKIIIKNIGRSPAMQVTTFAVILPVEKAISPIETIKDHSAKFGPSSIGHTIFPNHEIEANHSVGGVPIEYTKTPIPPCLLVCVKYKFTFADEVRQTSQLFSLVRIDTPTAQLFVCDLPTEPIRPESLVLIPISAYID